MRTPSLRRRVVLWSVGVLALLLLVVGVGVDLALGAVLKQEQRQRVESVASLASVLTGLSDTSLANQLSDFGVFVTIRRSSGQEIVGVPQAPTDPAGGPRPPAGPQGADVALTYSEEDGQLVATGTLRPGTTLILRSDSRQIDAALLRFRVIMAIASAVAVLTAALVLPVVLRRAMRPLDALTDAARDTAAGDRGRRLDPADPGTDLGRAARQFDAMLEELEGAERREAASAERLRRFLSDASHELRTPIAGMSAAAERLIREPLTDEEREAVVVAIVREARRGGRLVDDLLLASRLGELTIRARDQQVAPLLRLAAERAADLPASPEIEVLAADATAAVDAERFLQVVANLITNARNAGAATVRLRVRPEHDLVEIRVSDDGPGVPADSRELVFERLVRLDPARSARQGGAGLGLPIARGLVEAHGGTLRSVDPDEEDLPGAVFAIRLPLAEADRPRGSATESSVVPAATAP